MFGPLSFPSTTISQKGIPFINVSVISGCILCERKFNIILQEQEFLSHIFEEHRLVIADVPLIASMEKYIAYWRTRLKNTPLKDVCSTALVDLEKDGQILPNVEYFLLSDVLPEDRQLREGIQQKKLEWALEQQKLEREDNTFRRECLFCHLLVGETRAQYLDHLATQHNLQLGHPHNLVFIDDLIDKLREKLDRLECLYCEKVFRDKFVLKEHMRKKLWHKRINPENKDYDRFYIVNYLEPGKTWREQQGPERDTLICNEDAEWSDWTEDTGDTIVCLFCSHPSSSWAEVSSHMSVKHGFNYEQLTSDLNFYQQVKLVNYIRRQVFRQLCITCDEKFDTSESLSTHMEQSKHLKIPAAVLWDQPEYYFPTYDNDLFLCQIQDNKDTDKESKEDEVPSDLSEHEELIKQFQLLLSD